MQFKLSMHGDNYTITATSESGENPLAFMEDAVKLFGAKTVNITTEQGAGSTITGWTMQADKKNVLDVLSALVGIHFQQSPPSNEQLQKLIDKVTRPSMCRQCGSAGLRKTGNIFKCEACGRTHFPIFCTSCGGDLILNGIHEMTCIECDYKFVIPAPVGSTEPGDEQTGFDATRTRLYDELEDPPGGLPTIIGIVPPPGGVGKTGQ